LSFGRYIVVLCRLVVILWFFRQRTTIQRPKEKEQQYNDQKTKSNNTKTKRQRTTIQQPKDKEQKNSDKKTRETIQRPKIKEQQYSDQKKKNNNTATKRQRTTIQRPKDKEQQYLDLVLLLFGFWSLYCCSLSFGRCIVVLCLLVAVLLFFVFWSLYY
jgi:ATP-dependent Zn protease